MIRRSENPAPDRKGTPIGPYDILMQSGLNFYEGRGKNAY